MQITCELPNAAKPGGVIVLLKITASTDKSASVWTKTTAAAMCSYGDHDVESGPFDLLSKTPFEKPF
jgi:hypothetical protein